MRLAGQHGVAARRMSVIPVDMPRRMANLSACRAVRDKSSQMLTPGTLVAIGANAPRISAGASA